MKSPASAKCLAAVACLTYLVLLWLVSGLLRTGSFVIFAVGVLALFAGVSAARRGRRRPLFVLSLAALMAAFVVGSLELTLRLAPSLLGGSLADHAFSRYHAQPGGIYERDVHLGYALKPDCSCRLFWHGHWWHHQTNAAGFRGAAVAQADAVFLGDSMIYGHGVENDQTVSSQYAARSGQSVANLGQQGTCLVQMAYRLRHTGLALRPRVVFVCSHFNDIDEGTEWYPPHELKCFTVSRPEEEYEPLARKNYWPKPWYRADAHLWDAHLAPCLCLAGALSGWQQALGDGSLRCREFGSAVEKRLFVPAGEAVTRPFAPSPSGDTEARSLGWQAHFQALAQMSWMCRQHGAKLVLFDLGYPAAFSAVIEAQAWRLGVTYSPAGRVALQRAQAGEEVYLANDGHWSAKGCAVIANELLRAVNEEDQ